MSGRPKRQSIQATYDSRETGPRYHVTSRVNGRSVAFMERIDDPFVRHTVTVCLLDLVRAVFRRGLTVEVTVGGDVDVMNDVLELDSNTLIAGSTRRDEFNAGIRKAIVRHVKEAEAADEAPADGWCNCQAIPDTAHYPGPWHPRGDSTCSHSSAVHPEPRGT